MYRKMMTLIRNKISGFLPWVRLMLFLNRIRRLMASIVVSLIGLLFFGLGCYILLLRLGGVADLIRPSSLSVGQITVDGKEGRGYAELLRARYNRHLRHPASIAIETGFLGVVSLNTPELFQPKALDTERKVLTFEVKGVDVPKVIQLINQLFQPDQWIIEGDFQSHSNRVLLILRLRRGDRVIRTSPPRIQRHCISATG